MHKQGKVPEAAVTAAAAAAAQVLSLACSGMHILSCVAFCGVATTVDRRCHSAVAVQRFQKPCWWRQSAVAAHLAGTLLAFRHRTGPHRDAHGLLWNGGDCQKAICAIKQTQCWQDAVAFIFGATYTEMAFLSTGAIVMLQNGLDICLVEKYM